MQQIAATPPGNPMVYADTGRRCTHSRIVDEVRSPVGAKTGRLVCLECFAEFPDPANQVSTQ